MEIELCLSDTTIIAPKRVEIEGYHIIGKDDKLVITLAEGTTSDWFDKISTMLEDFSTKPDCKFLLLTSDNKVTVLKKEDKE